MSDHVVRVSHADRYRDLFDQVEADPASDGSGTPAGEHVPASLSGGLDPTTLPGTDTGSVLAREEMRVEHRHDGRVEIVHGTSGFDQGDRDRRSEAQRDLRSDRTHGRRDEITRAMQES